MLANSNIIIYATRPEYGALRAWLQATLPKVSAITSVEVLGYHRLQADERAALEAIFAALEVLYLTPVTVATAIELRQQRKMSLGDALIAATALEHRLPLATHNVADFAWIPGLSVATPPSG